MTIRAAVASDTDGILEVVIAAGMFTAGESGAVRQILDDFHAGRASEGCRLAVSGAEEVAGVVYFGPEKMSDQVWNLWMLAVRPGGQRAGIGKELVRFAEEHCWAEGGRMMLIETGSAEQYEGSRKFYVQQNYVEVARVPGYFGADDSKVIYQKRRKE